LTSIRELMMEAIDGPVEFVDLTVLREYVQ